MDRGGSLHDHDVGRVPQGGRGGLEVLDVDGRDLQPGVLAEHPRKALAQQRVGVQDHDASRIAWHRLPPVWDVVAKLAVRRAGVNPLEGTGWSEGAVPDGGSSGP